jgi:hypothetical protein
MESSQPAVPNTSRPEPPTIVPGRGLVRFLYTNNPFYAISAALVFYGLRTSFNTAGPDLHNGTLMSALAGYTLLLAATAYLLIRLGRVWDDARSLFLLVVLMFLALSVTFDDALAMRPVYGRRLDAAGLILVVAISEWLLRGLNIRLGAYFRIPYYLILALFFLYPAAISPWVGEPTSERLQWSLFGFSPMAALIALTLLPAIRRGASYVSNNGTPWLWPWFPWSLFFVLGLGACVRAYYLCVSLHFAAGSATIFGPYFLVPLLGAVAVLLLEAGLTSRSQVLQNFGLAMAPLLVLLSGMGGASNQVYSRFLSLFEAELHSTPLFLTLTAAVGFYALAAARRVLGAPALLFLSLLGLSFYRPESVRLDEVASPAWAPVFLAGLMQLVHGVRRRQSVRALAAVSLILAEFWFQGQGSWFSIYGGMIPLNLFLLAVLVIGAANWNDFAWWLRRAGAVAIVAVVAGFVFGLDQLAEYLPDTILYGYPVALTAVAFAYAYLVREPVFYCAGGASASSWGVMLGWRGYVIAREQFAGLDHVALGAIFFLVALAISMLKAGFADRLPESVRSLFMPPRPPPSSCAAEHPG